MNGKLYPEVFPRLVKTIEPTPHRQILKRQIIIHLFMTKGNSPRDVTFHKINGVDQEWANSCPGAEFSTPT